MDPYHTFYEKRDFNGEKRYFTSQYWMTRGKFPASRGAVLMVSGIAALVRSCFLFLGSGYD